MQAACGFVRRSAIALRNYFFALVVMFHLDVFVSLDRRFLAQ